MEIELKEASELKEVSEKHNEIDRRREEKEEIKEMIRHLHNDVHNLGRQIFRADQKLERFIEHFRLDGDEIDEIINLSRGNYSEIMDDMYSPIDKVDKERWKKHLEKERIEMGNIDKLIRGNRSD